MKKIAVVLIIALLSVVATYTASLIPLVRAFELKSIDKQFQLYADPQKADKRIVFVEVDQPSLDHFEKDNIPFPWPRTMYSPIIDYCAKGGAKAIIFDILFNNMSPYGEEEDQSFANTIEEAGNVYMAAAFMESGAGPSPEIGQSFGLSFEGDAPPAITKNSVSLPLDVIRDAVKGIGSVTFKPDEDGVYRRISPMVRYGDFLVPGLSLAPLVDKSQKIKISKSLLTIANMEIPIDSAGNMWINYQGPRGTYRWHSAAEVISSAMMVQNGDEPLILQSEFRDAYVIIGYTAPGIYDLKPTPMSAVSPGMAAHAALLDTLLNERFLKEAPVWVVALIGFIGAMIVAMAVISVGSPIISGFLVLAVAITLFVVSGEFFKSGLIVNLVTVEVPLALSLVMSAVYRFQFEGKQRRYIKKAFQHYVSPNVVEQMLKEPDKLKLGGEKRYITVFFSDLVGFTSLSEKTEPNELVLVLNEYTTLMAETITERGGTVDKYIGDAVMAFWGAPVDQDEKATKACITALETFTKLKAFSDKLVAQGLTPVDMRIGLNSGYAIVGNMGSADRFDYTALGDTVNQGARLEGLNNAYGTKILAAEATWMEAKEAVFGRKVDYLTVKGKEIPITVYEIMAKRGEETKLQRMIAEKYETAFALYLSRDWEKSAPLFEEILKVTDDGPSKVLLERSRLYLKTPPPDDWNGSFRHTSK